MNECSFLIGYTLSHDLIGCESHQNENLSKFITPPFKPALWPTIKIFASWSKSGCDSLSKCLPSLLPALGHPASTGEALDAIVTLANAGSGTGSSNETLEKCLLEAIMNLEVPVQTKLITITAVAACAKADLIGQAALRKLRSSCNDKN